MSRKNKHRNNIQADENIKSEGIEDLTPPEAKPKKKNGFMAMLDESNERRKQRVKKYRDAKRNKNT